MMVKQIEMGSHEEIVIKKVFGPLIMCDLRISVDPERGEWIIERQVLNDNDNGIGIGQGIWETAARLDGQNTLNFED